MAWREDAEQGFPPQRHQEPLSLRQDILDELSDHLTLAAEREAEAGAETDEEIRTRVLGKFGSPTAIARNLWWGAMKGTVMKDWIQISFNAILCIGVLAFMALFYNQMQSSNNALLTALKDQNTPQVIQDPSVEFIFHRGKDNGPVVEGVKVELIGKAFSNDDTSIEEYSDKEGCVSIGPVQPGRYKVWFTDTDKPYTREDTLILFAGKENDTMHIALPPSIPTPLDTSKVLSQYKSAKDMVLLMFMRSNWIDGEHVWQEKLDDYTIQVSSKGMFRTKIKPSNRQLFQPVEPIQSLYGNQIELLRPSIGGKSGGDGWYLLNQPNREAERFQDVLNLDPEIVNPIILNLPESLIKDYDVLNRRELNSDHNLPIPFSWFTVFITSRYPKYVIDKAHLVEQSAYVKKTNDHFLEYFFDEQGAGNKIYDDTGQLFSFENAPSYLPVGYKLLLGLRGQNAKLHSLDIPLNIYLTPTEEFQFKSQRIRDENIDLWSLEPYQSLNVEKLSSSENGPHFIDLTEMFHSIKGQHKKHGVFFRWDDRSNNSIKFQSPEIGDSDEQPVWIVLKPYGVPEPESLQAITDANFDDPLMQFINMDFENIPFQDACEALFRKGNLDVAFDTNFTFDTTTKLNETTLGEAIDVLLRMHGVVLVKEGNTYRLVGKSKAEKDGLDTSMDFLSGYILSKDNTQELIDVQFDGIPLNKVVSVLAQKARINAIMSTEIHGTVTYDHKQMPIGKALETLLRMNDLGIVKEGAVYRITTEEEATDVRDGNELLFQ